MEWLLFALLCFQTNPVLQMDSPDFRVRQAAQRQLEAHPWAYLPRMIAARQYGSPEARARVTVVFRQDIDAFCTGVEAIQEALCELHSSCLEYRYGPWRLDVAQGVKGVER